MNKPTARVHGLTLQADREQWLVCGIVPPESDADPLIGGIRFSFLGSDSNDSTFDGAGVVSWSIEGTPGSQVDVDGIPTKFVMGEDLAEAPVGSLGITAVDHIVINTDDLERTCDAIANATGCELRRVREVGEMRQGFHKFSNTIVEVVQRPGLPAGSSIWGITFIVDDLDRACEWLGPDVVSPPKDAVQDGRRIATIRAIAGLNVPVALMSR